MRYKGLKIYALRRLILCTLSGILIKSENKEQERALCLEDDRMDAE